MTFRAELSEKSCLLLFSGRGKIVVSVGKCRNEWKTWDDFTGFLSRPATSSPPGGTCESHASPTNSAADDAALWACPVGVSVRFLTLGPSVTGRPLSPPPSFDMCPAVGCDSYFFSLAVPVRQTLPWRTNGRGYGCSRDLCGSAPINSLALSLQSHWQDDWPHFRGSSGKFE
jgi:hypothetical protein